MARALIIFIGGLLVAAFLLALRWLHMELPHLMRAWARTRVEMAFAEAEDNYEHRMRFATVRGVHEANGTWTPEVHEEVKAGIADGILESLQEYPAFMTSGVDLERLAKVCANIICGDVHFGETTTYLGIGEVSREEMIDSCLA